MKNKRTVLFKMNYTLLDGKKLADNNLHTFKKKINEDNITANLAVILAGNNPASELYVKIKHKRCKEIGIGFELIRFKEDISEEEIKTKIKELNNNKKITGILVQLPMPKTLNVEEIVNTILPEKDVDCLTSINNEKLAKGDETLACCTPKGILQLLERNNINLNHKKVVLVGYGSLVGKPLSLMLKNRSINFTVCDIFTKNIKEKIKEADILITATGVPHLIKKEYVKDNVVIVDAGTSKLNNKIVGDVDFNEVREKTSYITPVPGGVGPMTVAMLMGNILDAYDLQKKKEERSEILRKRRNMQREDIIEKERHIREKLLSFNEFQTSKKILIYFSQDNEVPTKKIIELCFKSGKQVYLPTVEGNTLCFYEFKKGEKLNIGKYGIHEPKKKEGNQINKEEADIVLIPGVVFDNKGNRIGYGKGYYDNFLENINSEKIALAYDFQVLSKIYHNNFDIKVDKILTEKRTIIPRNKIKMGLKLWSTNSNLLNEAKKSIKDNIFQYIELTPIPDTDITPFLEYNLPYVIHITTERHGLNIADKLKKERNQELINNCIEWADKLNAKYLILHPGFGFMSNTLNFLDELNDKRILIENMPKAGLNGEKMVGYTPNQIKELTSKKFGFCLDLNHAIKAAISLKRPYRELIEEFLKLNPKMFHISDGKLDNEKDEHLSIGEGEYDFRFLMKCIKGSKFKCVTLETPRTNINSLEEAFINFKRLLNV